MADEAQGNDQVDQTGTDEVKNLKGEMGRKFDNLQDALKKQNAEMQKIVETLQAQTRQKSLPIVEEKQVSIGDMLFENADAAVETILSRAEQRLDSKINRRDETMATVSRITGEYPEFLDQNSDVYRLAVQKQSALAPSLQNTPDGIKIAMYEAASEVGLLPKSKRQSTSNDDNDDFVQSGGSSSAGRTRTREKSDKIDPKTVEWARLLGVPVEDPKRMESLKNRAKRGSWGKYE